MLKIFGEDPRLLVVCQLLNAHISAYHYGDFEAYLIPRFEDAVCPFLGALITSITQLYLATNLYKLANIGQYRQSRTRQLIHYTVAGIVALAIVASCVAGSIMSWEMYIIGRLSRLDHKMPSTLLWWYAAPTWLSLSSAIDLFLA